MSTYLLGKFCDPQLDAIGKHALSRLAKIFTAEPFGKNSKSQRKEYVENELNGLAYIYRDPQTKVSKCTNLIIAQRLTHGD